MISPIATIAAPIPSRPRAGAAGRAAAPPPRSRSTPATAAVTTTADDVPRPRQAQAAERDHVEEEQAPVGPVGDRERRRRWPGDDVGAGDDRPAAADATAPAHGVEEEREEDDERGGDGDDARRRWARRPSSPTMAGQRDERSRRCPRRAPRAPPEPVGVEPALSAPSPCARSASPGACRSASQIASRAGRCPRTPSRG